MHEASKEKMSYQFFLFFQIKSFTIIVPLINISIENKQNIYKYPNNNMYIVHMYIVVTCMLKSKFKY